MQKLNFPEYSFKIRKKDLRTEIFDIIRKKYVALTPEEWVRQNVIMYLISEKNFPQSLIAIEMGFKLYHTKKRSDIVVYDNTANPIMIIECKAPEIKINQKVFDQIARYNMALKVKYFIITNGLIHYCCIIDYSKKNYQFIKNIPDYQEL
ncbi:MAG: type I restriction enzyme HsdR N-terminal domain-containing protein [Bacteroidales bacterium]|nr:type I restriction enzyme HsdR N-terminal domain-containing protein [Bacteroidales bacterium]